MHRWQNWSGHLSCTPQDIVRPESTAALQEAMRGTERVRVAGSGHSFTEIVPTEDTLISLERLSGLVSVDAAKQRARVYAGTTISDLGPLLATEGLALANQGDIDAQAIAGAVATGTHGTGTELGCIASGVTGFTWVTADGGLQHVSETENPELLLAGPVSLGALGVFAEIELACVPLYNLRERVWPESLETLLPRWGELCAAHRHFEFFAFPFTGHALAKSLDPEPYGDVPASRVRPADSAGGGFSHLLALNREAPQQAREIFSGLIAAIDESAARGPSFRVFPSVRTDLFNEMEFAVPRQHAIPCLREILQAIEQADLPVLFPIEVRTAAADELWLSPFHQRASAVLAVHQDAELDFHPVFEVAEPILRRHGGRPHWGKIHTLGPAELAALYPRWDDFCALRRELDPQGKLLNPYLAQLFGAGETAS
jgi:FAD-linked oxidoreductase